MLVNDIVKHIEEWAPPGVAWEGDNVGLQIGSRWNSLKGILLCLELNEKTLDEAISKKCNFIFTHHPLIFKPLKRINPDNDIKSRLIEKLIKNDINLFTAHTNLDFTKDGVSFEMAKTLGLKNIRFLENESATQYKLVVFVAKEYADKVSESIFTAGGGIIGEYSHCSFNLEGKGTFKGSDKSNPSYGKKNNFESIEEVRIEVIVDKWNLSKVIKSMLNAHPYEEPAYDIYKLDNNNVNFGSGAVGQLQEPISVNEFLGLVSKKLRTRQVRYCKGMKNKIKNIAVHGGSISNALNAALKVGADALIAADIKYHTFQDAEDRILLIDAGHYETEVPVLNIVRRKLQKLLDEKKSGIKIYKSKISTNPIKIFNY